MTDKNEFEYTKIEDLTTPKNGAFNVYVDFWWIVTPDGELMFYRGYAAQCNADKRISDSMCERIYSDCSVQQIPVVYIPYRD